jgi:hypothetical protein
MRRLSLSLCVLFLPLLAGVAADEKDAKSQPDRGAFRPKYDESFLELPKGSAKAVKVIAPPRHEEMAGERRLVMGDDAVSEIDPKTGKERWSAKSPDGFLLRWLGADEAIAYFSGYRPAREKEDPQPESPAVVRRLDLKTHKWLDSLTVAPKDKKDGKRREVIQAAFVDGGRLFVLSVLLKEEQKEGQPVEDHLDAYRVTCFQEGKSAWSTEYPSRGGQEQPGVVLLWSARRPDFASSSVQHLTRIGDDVLVCAGGQQDLIRLDMATGKERWRVPRVWEFRRGFMGPSVWSHFISRYGVEPGLEDEAAGKVDISKEDQKRAKAALDRAVKEQARFECDIVGGPVVITGPGRGGRARHTVFVAVARAARSEFAGYLSDCIVYELDGSGKPLGMATLPRMVNGWQFARSRDGVIWGCQKGAMVRIAAGADDNPLLDMGPGGPDLVCRVDWYRQPRAARPKAWLRADPASEAVAFTPTHAFRAAAGGYVGRRDESVYRFPITVIELTTGTERTITLAVPVAGKIPEPNKNFSKMGETISTYGAYLLGVTDLRMEGQSLRVILATKESAAEVEFDLGRYLRDGRMP